MYEKKVWKELSNRSVVSRCPKRSNNAEISLALLMTVCLLLLAWSVRVLLLLKVTLLIVDDFSGINQCANWIKWGDVIVG